MWIDEFEDEGECVPITKGNEPILYSSFVSLKRHIKVGFLIDLFSALHPPHSFISALIHAFTHRLVTVD